MYLRTPTFKEFHSGGQIFFIRCPSAAATEGHWTSCSYATISFLLPPSQATSSPISNPITALHLAYSELSVGIHGQIFIDWDQHTRMKA